MTHLSPAEADPSNASKPTLWQKYLTAALNFVGKCGGAIGEGRYLWENIYPQKDGVPAFQKKGGRYVVRLYHNGSWRLVVVDDLIPVCARFMYLRVFACLCVDTLTRPLLRALCE